MSRMKLAMFFSYSSLNAWLMRSFHPWCQPNPASSYPRSPNSGNSFFRSPSTAFVRLDDLLVVRPDFAARTRRAGSPWPDSSRPRPA